MNLGEIDMHIRYIIQWALHLVGHEVYNHIVRGDWVASSYSGQVIMPRIILGHAIPRTGFASLALFQGTLMLET